MLVHRTRYRLPDGTPAILIMRTGHFTREWMLVAPSGTPLYLLDRDNRSFLRFVEEERGLVPVLSDLQMADLRVDVSAYREVIWKEPTNGA